MEKSTAEKGEEVWCRLESLPPLLGAALEAFLVCGKEDVSVRFGGVEEEEEEEEEGPTSSAADGRFGRLRWVPANAAAAAAATAAAGWGHDGGDRGSEVDQVGGEVTGLDRSSWTGNHYWRTHGGGGGVFI